MYFVSLVDYMFRLTYEPQSGLGINYNCCFLCLYRGVIMVCDWAETCGQLKKQIHLCCLLTELLDSIVTSYTSGDVSNKDPYIHACISTHYNNNPSCILHSFGLLILLCIIIVISHSHPSLFIHTPLFLLSLVSSPFNVSSYPPIQPRFLVSLVSCFPYSSQSLPSPARFK
jgi:hypothetical protein